MNEQLPSTTTQEDGLIDLTTLAGRVAKNIGLIAGLSAMGLAVATLYTLFVPPKYEAKCSLYFPSKVPSVLGSDAASPSSALAALGQPGATPIDIFRGFLESESAVDEVRTKELLTKKELEKKRRFETDFKDNTLTLYAYDGDKSKALSIIESYLKALKKINERTQVAFYKDDLRVIESQLEKENAFLATAQDKFLQLSNKSQSAPSFVQAANSLSAVPSNWSYQYQAVSIELQRVRSRLASSKGMLRKLASDTIRLPESVPGSKDLYAQLVSAETELKIKSQSLGSEAPEIRHLNEKIGILKSKLSELASKFAKSVASESVTPDAESELKQYLDLNGQYLALKAQATELERLKNIAPGEAANLTAVLGEIDLHKGIVARLAQQLSLAKVQVERDQVKWNILDSPRVDEEPVNKHWLPNLSAGFAVGLALSLLLAIRPSKR